MAERAFAVPPALTQAPALTMPEAEADLVRRTYEATGVILEYGSGGSTVLAAAMPGKTVFSVESDKVWCEGLQDWFAANPPAARVVLHHADVGPTGKWGRPVGDRHWRRFAGYPYSVWARPDFLHPDVVLVDGRFRAACFLAVLFSITRPVTLLFDDYTERPAYHDVARFGAPAELVGRMARFDLAPTPVPAALMPWIFEVFARPL